MSFLPCPRCATPIPPALSSCPHCRATVSDGDDVRGLPMLLMGLLLAGCGDKDDTGDTADTGQVAQPEYGVAETSDE